MGLCRIAIASCSRVTHGCGRPASRSAKSSGILYTGIGIIMYVWLVFFCSLWLDSQASPAQAKLACSHLARLQGCVVYSLLLLHARLASSTRLTLQNKGSPSVCIRVVNALSAHLRPAGRPRLPSPVWLCARRSGGSTYVCRKVLQEKKNAK